MDRPETGQRPAADDDRDAGGAPAPAPAPGDEGAPDLPLLHQLARTFTALKRAYEERLGMPPPAALILSLLIRRDGLTQNELTGLARVDPSMITRTVKEMEGGHGWISRARDPADNRLVRVYLTDAGRARAAGLHERFAEIERRLTRGLSERRVREFRATLRHLEEEARNDLGE